VSTWYSYRQEARIQARGLKVERVLRAPFLYGSVEGPNRQIGEGPAWPLLDFKAGAIRIWLLLQFEGTK